MMGSGAQIPALPRNRWVGPACPFSPLSLSFLICKTGLRNPYLRVLRLFWRPPCVTEGKALHEHRLLEVENHSLSLALALAGT